ncbi:YnfU family zinc-binding protein [Pantoea septica]|uniref:YnfU family zinc-binding protein n=1 Tax=Pantoea septica TaxID=472695 RepID=UPI00289976E1|nr:YnfU family zinc-binding protein [Pantoea septica]
MFIIDYVMKLMGGASTAAVTCPLCGLETSQPSSKIRAKQTMLCPGCKAMFVSKR